ncbi:MAG: hypothetical protein ACK44M_04975 [Chloroflexus sp.]
MVAGNDHTCGLASNGIVHCRGKNDSGQIGDSTAGYNPFPVRVVDSGGGEAPQP